MNVITQFQNEYRFLSNFWYMPDGLTVEHWYQAAKTNDKEWKHKILNTSSPGQAKKLGRQVPLRRDWEDVKLSVMEQLLRLKFSFPELRQHLIDTYPAELIEGNFWHDNGWGDCYCDKCKYINGKNNLGKLLMKIRDEIMRDF